MISLVVRQNTFEKLESLKHFHATDIWFNSILASQLCAKIWLKLILTQG